jgi:hypothetical protein
MKAFQFTICITHHHNWYYWDAMHSMFAYAATQSELNEMIAID